MQLYFSDGSPYARVARILISEAGLAVEPVRETQFPPQRVSAVNPALQVPALDTGSRRLFGTRLIAEYLLSLPRDGAGAEAPPLAAAPVRPEDPWQDAQVLTALETLLGSLVLRSYLVWTGAEHRPDAAIPLDLAERELERSLSLLDWLEAAAGPEGFLPGSFSLQDIWLVATLEWTEARLPVPWRGRPRLEALLARYRDRPSVAGTRPAPLRI